MRNYGAHDGLERACFLQGACTVAAAALLWTYTAIAADITWTGGSGYWTNAAKWSPPQVPTASDHVTLAAGTVGIVYVPALATFSNMDWTSGYIHGPLTVSSNSLLNLSGSASKYLQGSLTNAGTVVWSDAGALGVDVSAGPPGIGVYNLPGALFDIQNGATLFNSTGTVPFNNAGTVRKSAGSGTNDITWSLKNSGLVEVQTSAINLTGGGTLGGTFTTASGAFINLDGGDFTVVGAPVFGGQGQSQFIWGILHLDTDIIPNLALVAGYVHLGPMFQGGSITNFTLPSGVYLTTTNVVSGTFNWTGGYIGSPSGSLSIMSNGVLNMSGSTTKYLGGPLTNAGTVVWSDVGDLYLNNGAVYNMAGGLVDIQSDLNIVVYSGSGVFVNSGTVRKSAGSGATSIYPQFSNFGLVGVQSGTLQFAGPLDLSAGEVTFGLTSLTDFGSIDIPGQAVLGGTVGVALLNGYAPATNDSFTLLTYTSYTGMFTNVDLPPGPLWGTNYNPTSFVLTIAASNKLAFTTQPAARANPGVILPPVVVQVEQPIGMPVADTGIPVTLSLSSGAGTLSGSLTQATDATGKATFYDLSIDQLGYKTLLASAPNLTPALSAVFEVVPLTEIYQTGSGMFLRFNGPNEQGPVVIYASPDLSSWAPIYTNPPTPNAIEYLDTSSTNYPRRFYRAVQF
jgi:hypothetical protein